MLLNKSSQTCISFLSFVAKFVYEFSVWKDASTSEISHAVPNNTIFSQELLVLKLRVLLLLVWLRFLWAQVGPTGRQRPRFDLSRLLARTGLAWAEREHVRRAPIFVLALGPTWFVARYLRWLGGRKHDFGHLSDLLWKALRVLKHANFANWIAHVSYCFPDMLNISLEKIPVRVKSFEHYFAQTVKVFKCFVASLLKYFVKLEVVLASWQCLGLLLDFLS